MNNKAPEEIYLRSWAPGSGMEVFSERCYKTDIKYIRADLVKKKIEKLLAHCGIDDAGSSQRNIS